MRRIGAVVMAFGAVAAIAGCAGASSSSSSPGSKPSPSPAPSPSPSPACTVPAQLTTVIPVPAQFSDASFHLDSKNSGPEDPSIFDAATRAELDKDGFVRSARLNLSSARFGVSAFVGEFRDPAGAAAFGNSHAVLEPASDYSDVVRFSLPGVTGATGRAFAYHLAGTRVGQVDILRGTIYIGLSVPTKDPTVDPRQVVTSYASSENEILSQVLGC